MISNQKGMEKYINNYNFIDKIGDFMAKKPYVYLDKVEKKFLAQIKAVSPQYADLGIEQIAHLELKTRLIEVLKSAGGGI